MTTHGGFNAQKTKPYVKAAVELVPPVSSEGAEYQSKTVSDLKSMVSYSPYLVPWTTATCIRNQEVPFQGLVSDLIQRLVGPKAPEPKPKQQAKQEGQKSDPKPKSQDGVQRGQFDVLTVPQLKELVSRCVDTSAANVNCPYQGPNKI